MKYLNPVMQIISILIATIGMIGACIVNDSNTNWFKLVLTFGIMIIIGFGGFIFFDDPARLLKYFAGAITVIFAAIYSISYKSVKSLKPFYKFKVHCGSYRKTFRLVEQNYYNIHSTYYDTNDSEVLDSDNKYKT